MQQGHIPTGSKMTNPFNEGNDMSGSALGTGVKLFGANISRVVGLESEERKRDLKRWLSEWPVPAHSDDKTIACLFKKGGSQ